MREERSSDAPDKWFQPEHVSFYFRVTEAKYIGIAEWFQVEITKLSSSGWPHHRSDLCTEFLQPLQIGRRAEIDFINGVIVELGKAAPNPELLHAIH
jgi:ketopantoate reductase